MNQEDKSTHDAVLTSAFVGQQTSLTFRQQGQGQGRLLYRQTHIFTREHVSWGRVSQNESESFAQEPNH